MSPFRQRQRARLDARAESETPSTTDFAPERPWRLSIKHATDSPDPPPPAQKLTGHIAQPITAASDGTTDQQNHGMPTATKLGLGMIPVVVILGALYALFLFWYRRRRTAQKAHSACHPTPEKLLSSPSHSIKSARRSSKVFQMAAFSTPIYDDRGRKVSSGQYNQCRKGVNVKMQRPRSPHMVESVLDQRIDGTRSVGQKQNGTGVRDSRGSELAQFWPSPPPSALQRTKSPYPASHKKNQVPTEQE